MICSVVSIYFNSRQEEILLKNIIRKKYIEYFHNLQCLIYDFNMSPAELVDMPILIEVLNSKKMRSDCLVGSFKFDVGEVYVYSG